MQKFSFKYSKDYPNQMVSKHLKQTYFVESDTDDHVDSLFEQEVIRRLQNKCQEEPDEKK